MPLKSFLGRRPARWALAVLLWTAIGIFYSTKMAINGRPAVYIDSLKYSLAQWYIWGALAPLILGVDRRLPVRRDAFLRRGLFHLPLSFLFTTLYVYALEAARSLMGLNSSFSLSLEPLRFSWRGGFHWNYLVYWLIVGIYAAYDYSRDVQERRVQTAELERLLAESRLNTLRSQLHPHFLFNTLNAISAHVERNPRTARRMLEQLGELLRMSLDHAEDQEIPLEQELAFLERYLALQTVRFEDRLDAQVKVHPSALHGLVPTFLLQPLVENAIKHGVAPRSSRGLVRIGAWREADRLHLRVEDDGPGLPDGWRITVHQRVGLSNTLERLKRLYGDSGYQFAVTSEPGKGARVDVSLPFRNGGQIPDAPQSYAENSHAGR